jgi:hypothetical protein
LRFQTSWTGAPAFAAIGFLKKTTMKISVALSIGLCAALSPAAQAQ